MGGLCPGGVSVQRVSTVGYLFRGLCPGGLCLGVCLGVPVQEVSVQGSLCPGGGLCPEDLCPGGSLSGTPPYEMHSYWNAFLF